MDDKKSEKDTETVPNSRTQPVHKKRHAWLICLALTIVILVILLPIIFLVIFPSIIKNKINSAVLKLSVINFTTPITENSFLMHNEGEFTSDGSARASLTFPDPVNIRWNGTIIGNIKLEELNINHGNAKVNQSQTFNITDSNRWVEFVQVMFSNETFTWTLEGKSTAKALGITRKGIDFSKDIVIKGGQGFSNITLLDYTFASTTLANGTVIIEQIATSKLYSPSDITLFLGSVGLDIYYGQLHIGLVQANNQTLYPGENQINLRGPLGFDITKLPLPVLVDIGSKYIQGSNLTVNIRGAFAKPDGVNEISWLSGGIKHLDFNETVKISRNPILDGLVNGIMSGSTTHP